MDFGVKLRFNFEVNVGDKRTSVSELRYKLVNKKLEKLHSNFILYEYIKTKFIQKFSFVFDVKKCLDKSTLILSCDRNKFKEKPVLKYFDRLLARKVVHRRVNILDTRLVKLIVDELNVSAFSGVYFTYEGACLFFYGLENDLNRFLDTRDLKQLHLRSVYETLALVENKNWNFYLNHLERPLNTSTDELMGTLRVVLDFSKLENAILSACLVRVRAEIKKMRGKRVSICVSKLSPLIPLLKKDEILLDELRASKLEELAAKLDSSSLVLRCNSSVMNKALIHVREFLNENAGKQVQVSPRLDNDEVKHLSQEPNIELPRCHVEVNLHSMRKEIIDKAVRVTQRSFAKRTIELTLNEQTRRFFARFKDKLESFLEGSEFEIKDTAVRLTSSRKYHLWILENIIVNSVNDVGANVEFENEWAMVYSDGQCVHFVGRSDKVLDALRDYKHQSRPALDTLKFNFLKRNKMLIKNEQVRAFECDKRLFQSFVNKLNDQFQDVECTVSYPEMEHTMLLTHKTIDANYLLKFVNQYLHTEVYDLRIKPMHYENQDVLECWALELQNSVKNAYFKVLNKELAVYGSMENLKSLFNNTNEKQSRSVKVDETEWRSLSEDACFNSLRKYIGDDEVYHTLDTVRINGSLQCTTALVAYISYFKRKQSL